VLGWTGATRRDTERPGDEDVGYATRRMLTVARRRRLVWLSSVVAILLAVAPLLAPVADASSLIRAFTPRFQATTHGAIELIGNTIVTCTGAPISGAVTCPSAQAGGSANNNNFNMVPIDIDGDATTSDSSRASLALPAGSTILHAQLYWEGVSTAATRDTVLFATPGGVNVSVVASTLDVIASENYGATADVTSLVTGLPDPNGAYTIANLATTSRDNIHSGWSLIVAYENAGAPLRNLTIFDGFASINGTAPTSITTSVSGFITPATGPVTAQLGIVAGEGDLASTGDRFQVNGVGLTDALNPVDNVFNSTVSRLGTRISAKVPDYVNQLGWDVDLLNATGTVPNNATSATLTFTTGGETYYPLALTFAVDVFEPSLDVPKTGTDMNGGSLLPGDTIEYQLDVTNAGNDPATDVVLTDPVPANTAFVPGSLQIVSGPNAGAKTDATGDDQGEFAGGNVVFRLGTGATGAAGGTLAIGASTTVRFSVTLNAGTPPATVIHNQATVAYRGATTGTSYSGSSDGDSGAPGDQPVDLPVASPPNAVDDTATTAEDTPVDIAVLANDTDVDGDLDPTSVTITSGPSNGSVVVDPLTGHITYTPSPDYNGSDSFTYQVCDDAGLCDSANVALTVTAVNDPPTVLDDSTSTNEDAPVDIDVLANDTDVDGTIDPTSVTITSGPSNGSVLVDPLTGHVTYTPDSDFSGTDTFTYQVCDATDLCASATVTVTVSSIPEPPTVVDDTTTVAEDDPVVIDVLGNDSDPDGNIDPTSVTVTSGPSHGSVAVDPSTGLVTYTPHPDFNGTDTFTYRVCDTTDLCASGTVTVTVDPVADPPTVRDDAVSVSEDGAVAINVLGNDSDPDGDLDPASVTVTSGPSHGRVSIDPVTGTVTYTPDPGYAGPDGFTYQVCDATGLCTTGTVAITVVEVPPTDQTPTVTADAPKDGGSPWLPVIPLLLAAILGIVGFVRRPRPR
jgi:large repetitive protein